MPQRVHGALLALAGIVAVAGLSLVGRDVWLHARTGPSWKRRLVCAGLFMLAALGLVSCEGKPEPTPVEYRTASEQALADSPEWKRLVELWHEAEETASWRRGAHPFDEAGKAKLIADLEAATALTDALEARGLLAAHEADLLATGLRTLAARLERVRPVEMTNVTCYLPGSRLPPRRMTRTVERLPLLVQLLDSGKLRPEVVSRVLDGIRHDSRGSGNSWLDPHEEVSWQEFTSERQETEEALERLRRRAEEAASSGGGTFADTYEWRVIARAWHEVEPFALKGTGTEAERLAATAKLARAREAALGLALGGRLSWEEARMIRREANWLKRRVCRHPPPGVDEYEFLFSPGRTGLESLEALDDSIAALKVELPRKAIKREALELLVKSADIDQAFERHPRARAALKRELAAAARVSGNFALLARLYEDAFHAGGRPVDLVYPYIDALLRTKQYRKASKELECAIRAGYHTPWAFRSLATSYGKLRRRDGETLRAVGSEVELFPGDVDPRISLGQHYEKAGDGEAALRQYLEAARVRPEDRRLYRRTVALASRLGRIELARAAFVEAFGRLPNPERVWGPDLRDLVGLLQSYPQLAKGPDGAKLSRLVRRRHQAELAVVMTWDTTGTDVDLHVTEPGGEKCHYRHKRTASGGKLDNDDTDGLGPETYSVRRARPGQYRIDVVYYNGAPRTTVTVSVYRNRGGEDERVTAHQAELKKAKERVTVGTGDIAPAEQ